MADFRTFDPCNLLAPVPAVMVSCRAPEADAKPNIITVAWVGTVNSEPPMMSISVRGNRFSHDLIAKSGEFVVNLVDEAHCKALDFCGVRSGRDVDKWQECHLTPMKALNMDYAPAIAECPAYLACKVVQQLELGSPYLNLRLPGSLVAPNNKNTAIKAALAFFDYTGLLAGVDITIYKNTPVRAGMAGGSADAAAVLVGMNELYGAHLSMSELCALGAKIGADVPFALMGGTCRVQGVGDFLKALPPVPECWFTVVMPDYGVSTPEAFAAYDRVGSSIHPDCGAQEAAIRAGDLDALCAAAGNALEECSGAKDTGAIKALLREHGAVTALMTGSGAAVFGVFRDEGAARAAAQAAKRRWKQVYVAQPDRGGARVSR